MVPHTMRDTYWHEVRSLYGQLIQLPPSERGLELLRDRTTDPEVRVEVERLLGLPRDALTAAEAPLATPPPAPDATDADDLVGITVGTYELIELLGSGRRGAVYRARHTRLGHDLAVRVETGIGTRRGAADPPREHTVTVHDEGQAGPIHWTAMDLVDGHDLAREIAVRMGLDHDAVTILPRPDEPGWASGVARVMAQVATALERAHECGITHGAIHPRNVLLDLSGNAWLTDFGASRSADRGTQPGAFRYRSPAQIRGGATTPSDDIYATGVVLYELLAGRHPFAGRAAHAEIAAIERGVCRRLRSVCRVVPRTLARICDRAMATPTSDRYPTAAALREELERFLTRARGR